MLELSIGFAISAFIAGLLTFLAPCTLPLIPAYLGFISGVNTTNERHTQTTGLRRKIMWNGLAFVIGFSIVFIAFGILVGLAGSLVAPYKIWLGRVGGVFVIIFGLFMLGLFRLPFFSGKNLRVPKWISPGNPTSSLAIGGAFAFGWTPCIGPVLGTVLLLAGTSGTALQGGLLLLIFSVGLAIPFLALALAFSKMSHYIDRFSKFLTLISMIGGIFLIVLGLLLMTDNFGLVIQYGYHLLRPFNYQGILEFL
jgi:cytochrome c-type biogenesis protein